MPYVHELRNSKRAKRAILSGLLLACLLALLVFTPARILGWAGLGFGSLSVPETTVAAVDEPVAVASSTRFRTPPLVEQYTFPAYAEWTDMEAECSDCHSFGYGSGAQLDAADAVAMSRLEQAALIGPGAGIVSSGSRRANLGGFAGGGAGNALGLAAASAEQQPASTEPPSEAVEESAPAQSRAAGQEAARASERADSAGGDNSSSEVEASSDKEEAVEASEEAVEASASPEVPSLILLSIASVDEVVGIPPSGDTLPQDVVQALVESPVGLETVHAAGEPEVLRAALGLDEAVAALNGDDVAQQATVPEPMSLLLVGLGLSASVSRRRRAAR